MRLAHLKIENFAIIDRIEVRFEDGFTVITGETGAGKSIIIDALSLALGEKADLTMIRSGADKALIECEFAGSLHHSPLNAFLQEQGIDSGLGDGVILRRELNNAGRSRAWINDSPCPIAVLKEAGNLLVDLHGQHDHQSLLNEANHIVFLDAFGDYHDQITTVSQLWHEVKNLRDKRDNLAERHHLNLEKKELWEFQISEIRKTNPRVGEYQELVDEKLILENAEKLHQIASELSEALYEGEDTFYERTMVVLKKLRVLSAIDKSFGEYVSRLEETQYLFQDLSKSLSRYSTEIQFDPKRLETINQRLFLIQQLMKKYNRSVEELIAYQTEIMSKIDNDEGLALEIRKLDAELDQILAKYSAAALRLSQSRRDNAHVLEGQIQTVLERLGIHGSRFRVSIDYVPDPKGWVRHDGQNYRGDPNGMDNIAFEISTNPGEPLRPLVNIVSGGEVSRIMLALKSISAGRDRIPVLIFDEIDTGISGKIAHVVGVELKTLAAFHQVISITHLPQIAGLGHAHVSVEKTVHGDRTQTAVRKLSQSERVQEIAKLIGGERITATSLQQASELLQGS